MSEPERTTRDAVAASLATLAAVFGRRVPDQAVAAYEEVLRGIRPEYVDAATTAVLRGGQRLPTPGELLRLAVEAAKNARDFWSIPWNVPPWAAMLSPADPKTGIGRWGVGSGGGFWWPPTVREAVSKPGQVWSFDQDGRSAQIGWLVLDDYGYIVYCPMGSKAEDQAEWNANQRDIREEVKDIIRGIGERAAKAGTDRAPAKGVQCMAHALVKCLGKAGF